MLMCINVNENFDDELSDILFLRRIYRVNRNIFTVKTIFYTKILRNCEFSNSISLHYEM